MYHNRVVLILILMEDTLGAKMQKLFVMHWQVLILILMEDTLGVPVLTVLHGTEEKS